MRWPQRKCTTKEAARYAENARLAQRRNYRQHFHPHSVLLELRRPLRKDKSEPKLRRNIRNIAVAGTSVVAIMLSGPRDQATHAVDPTAQLGVGKMAGTAALAGSADQANPARLPAVSLARGIPQNARADCNLRSAIYIPQFFSGA